jgi:AhpD family alkylhydroperoxidase
VSSRTPPRSKPRRWRADAEQSPRFATGKLDAKFREQIALGVAQANSCEYCLSAHTAIGRMVGLKPDEIAGSREAHSSDAKRDAGLQFVQALVVQRGMVSDQALAQVKAAGFSDGIAEIVANVALNILTNYFNHVARTDVDFPLVPVAMETSAAAR